MAVTHEASTTANRTPSPARAGAGDEKLVSRKLVPKDAPQIEVRSPDFFDGGPLPAWASADGEGRAPEIRWGELPATTQSVALVCEDPDAPMATPFVHHLVYGIAPSARSLQIGVASAREGKNGAMKQGFTPAAPPKGHGVHRYYFQVFALDKDISLGADSTRESLVEAMKGAVIGYGEIIGTYERK
jgi:Raf kinase inhibitor-like YbhB/YbcL family protein